MRSSPAVISCATLIVALMLAGCGGSSSASSTLAVHFQSAEISPGRAIPARFTCDGSNISPSFEWGPVPSNTGELVLLVVGLTPTGIGNKYTVSIEWAVAGISPRIHKLVAGQLPQGAHVGLATNGKRGYSICPKKGVIEAYQFAIYAVRAAVAISPEFTGISALAEFSTPHTVASPIAQGVFIAHYKRT